MVFRAENVGSLLRAPALMNARAERDRGTLSAHDYKRIEDASVDDAIALQEASGIEVITDGEARRTVFTGSLIDIVEGIDGPPPPPTQWRGSEDYGTESITRAVAAHSISGKLRRVRSLAAEEYTYLRARTDRPVKVTLPSPLMLGKWWDPATSPDAYPDPIDAFADATAILSEEIRELARLGCTYVQIDAPEIATLVDAAVRKQYDDLGIGADRLLGEGVELLDSLARQAPSDVTLGLHLCKGNSDGRYLAEGSYDAIAEENFPRLGGYDVLMLEYDDARSGGFEPLAATLESQVVALGLVSTKSARLETDDEIVQRIEDAARTVPLERLALSCQCGFASTAGGNQITADVQRAKLELVGRVAEAVWA